MLEIMMHTKSQNGLILWTSKDSHVIADYLAVVLINGYLEFSFDLGKQSQYLSIRSTIRVDDGELHHFFISRSV